MGMSIDTSNSQSSAAADGFADMKDMMKEMKEVQKELKESVDKISGVMSLVAVKQEVEINHSQAMLACVEKMLKKLERSGTVSESMSSMDSDINLVEHGNCKPTKQEDQEQVEESKTSDGR